MSEASAQDIALELVTTATAIHDAMWREAQGKAKERAAGEERAAAATDRLNHQRRAAQLLAALGMGPNFPSILAQEMQ